MVAKYFVLKEVGVTGNPATARGAFGDVHKGLLRGGEVAVKVLRVYEESNTEELLKVNNSHSLSMSIEHCIQNVSSEAAMWQQLSHPNILTFYGIYYLDNDPCLVYPWMENGNVVQFLRERAPDADCVLLVRLIRFWHWIYYNCFIQSLDVAEGLEYLHSKNIIHGDLKGVSINAIAAFDVSERAISAQYIGVGVRQSLHSRFWPCGYGRI